MSTILKLLFKKRLSFKDIGKDYQIFKSIDKNNYLNYFK